MKIFEMPVAEVVKFAVEDVITVSGGEETTIADFIYPCVD